MTAKKIINTTLIILLAIVVTGASLYFTQTQKKLLTGSILDGATPADIYAIEFVTPNGTTSPINNVVTIEAVFVDFLDTTTYADGNIYGDDIVSSFITFQPCTLETGTCISPSGVTAEGNKIFTPDTFIDFYVRILVPGDEKNTTDLKIKALDCSYLATTIMKGTGQGAYLGTGTLPGPSHSSDIDFSGSIETITLSYPTTTVPGAQTFQITLDFVPGLTERAVITSNSGTGEYEIDVRDEGVDTVETASNFAYVFNDLMQVNSPVTAAYVTGSKIRLTSKELGIHTNSYVYYINDGSSAFAFTGATPGSVDVLTVPLTLDNAMTEGDTALVYAAGSVGAVTWSSSHPSILEVSSIGESEESVTGAADFTPKTIDSDEEYDTPAVELDCQYEDENDDGITDGGSCTVEVTIPVTYEPPSNGEVTVTFPENTYTVPVEFSGLIGNLHAETTWNFGDDLISLYTVGSVTGSFNGTATGDIQGPVNGSVIADITRTINVDISTPDEELSLSEITSAVSGSIDEITAEQLDLDGDLTSAITEVGTTISEYALLTAKRGSSPINTAILTIVDEQGCIASLDVQVHNKKVILQMADRDPSDVFEVGEQAQINAYLGSSVGELDEDNNVTSASGIEWVSSNPDVATIDPTGILTAVASGTTNITATYDSGEPEMGPVESDPLTIKVNKVTGLTIALDEDTQALLPVETKNAAYQSVLIAIHKPTVAGKTITIEGVPLSAVLPELPEGEEYENDLAEVDAIVNDDTDGLKEVIGNIMDESIPVVTVSSVSGFPGILLLEPTAQQSTTGTGLMHNGIIDISTTATQEQMSIIPNFGSGINLPAADTYELMVVAEYDNGRTKRLPATSVTWVNTPINYLEDASLDTGLLVKGEISGTSTVQATFQNLGSNLVTSNPLSVTVASGPVIKFIKRIGTGAITKGSAINLQVKVTDVDTIADIQDISVSIVKSTFSTYNQIDADPLAVWFTATPYPDEIIVEDESEPVEEGDTAPDAPVAPVFKIYNLPVDIPIDSTLYDGWYKLVLTITDTMSHTMNAIYPIYIGELASGDVSGDGNVNMVDVIVAFQIAAGNMPGATQAQLEAADVNGQDGVNMVDVILLFQQVIAST